MSVAMETSAGWATRAEQLESGRQETATRIVDAELELGEAVVAGAKGKAMRLRGELRHLKDDADAGTAAIAAAARQRELAE